MTDSMLIYFLLFFAVILLVSMAARHYAELAEYARRDSLTRTRHFYVRPDPFEDLSLAESLLCLLILLTDDFKDVLARFC